MNTLDDLRATLDRHADDIDNDTTTARVTSVRARAVRARRQRAGAVVGSAAAVATVVAAAALLPAGTTEPGPADRSLLGRTAPAELSALGYTYAFDEGVENEDGASAIQLEASDEPRLLTWATGDTLVRVVDPYDVAVSDRVEFDDWAYVAPGQEGTWTVHATNSALAVYELTDDRPAGVTVDGTTFREQVGSDLLLDAEIGEVGQDEVTVTYTVPEGRTRWATFCQGAPEKAWLHVDLGPRIGEFLSGPACDDPAFDPGGQGGSSGRHGRTGETLTATLYLTDGARGPRIDSDEVRLGLAAYAQDRADRVAGSDVPELFEDGGHLWSFDGSVTEPRGTTSTAHRNDSGTTELVYVTSSGSLRTWLRADFGGGDGVMRLQGGGGTWGTLLPGARLRLTAPSAAQARLRLGYAWYERAD